MGISRSLWRILSDEGLVWDGWNMRVDVIGMGYGMLVYSRVAMNLSSRLP